MRLTERDFNMSDRQLRAVFPTIMGPARTATTLYRDRSCLGTAWKPPGHDRLQPLIKEIRTHWQERTVRSEISIAEDGCPWPFDPLFKSKTWSWAHAWATISECWNTMFVGCNDKYVQVSKKTT